MNTGGWFDLEPRERGLELLLYRCYVPRPVPAPGFAPRSPAVKEHKVVPKMETKKGKHEFLAFPPSSSGGGRGTAPPPLYRPGSRAVVLGCKCSSATPGPSRKVGAKSCLGPMTRSDGVRLGQTGSYVPVPPERAVTRHSRAQPADPAPSPAPTERQGLLPPAHSRAHRSGRPGRRASL